ncbi:Clec16a, partial [Symbiodinium pilosum]
HKSEPEPATLQTKDSRASAEEKYLQDVVKVSSRHQHDPSRWKKEFADAGDGTNNPDMNCIRKLRKEIWNQTEMIFQELDESASLDKARSTTLFQPGDFSNCESPAVNCGHCMPEVEVVECDILDKAEAFAKEMGAVAVLNMASASSPGGGVRNGAGAQEENLCRRSDLYRFLAPQWRSLYPIQKNACLISENVTILRGSEKNGYPFLDQPFKVTILTCAALQRPPISGQRYRDPQDENCMREKVRAILGAAQKSGCRACVLSAFGCGAFGNPPEAVARLFKEELRTAKLHKVSFCIFNDHNAGRAHNPRGNYIPFKEVFELDVMSVCNLLECAVGQIVAWLKVWALADEWQRCRILRIEPGEVQIQWLEADVAPLAGSNATLPPTRLRLGGKTIECSEKVAKLKTRLGGLCGRAALCLFGRVGNLFGPFHEDGSTGEVLEISAPSVWEHVVRANSDLHWDIFAHTWDESLAPAIEAAFAPVALHAEPQPDLPTVQSFGETCRRSVQLKRDKEIKDGMRYDLVVLMRAPLRLSPAVGSAALWSGHWCSIHAEDLSLRELAVLTHDPSFRHVRYRPSGVFAPSQFAPTGLHDFWFAGSSAVMDRFASWGLRVPELRARFGLQSDEVPVDVGHFYTFLHAKELGLPLKFEGISNFDYTLVRYRNCTLLVGEQIRDPDIFCSHWEISMTRECESWRLQQPGWAAQYCPLAGKRAELVPWGKECGPF